MLVVFVAFKVIKLQIQWVNNLRSCKWKKFRAHAICSLAQARMCACVYACRGACFACAMQLWKLALFTHHTQTHIDWRNNPSLCVQLSLNAPTHTHTHAHASCTLSITNIHQISLSHKLFGSFTLFSTLSPSLSRSPTYFCTKCGLGHRHTHTLSQFSSLVLSFSFKGLDTSRRCAETLTVGVGPQHPGAGGAVGGGGAGRSIVLRTHKRAKFISCLWCFVNNRSQISLIYVVSTLQSCNSLVAEAITRSLICLLIQSTQPSKLLFV